MPRHAPASLVVPASRGGVREPMALASCVGEALDSRLRGNDGEVSGWRFSQGGDTAMHRLGMLDACRFDKPRTPTQSSLVIPESRSDIRDPVPSASRAGKALDSRLRGNDGEGSGWCLSQSGDVVMSRVVALGARRFDKPRTPTRPPLVIPESRSDIRDPAPSASRAEMTMRQSGRGHLAARWRR